MVQLQSHPLTRDPVYRTVGTYLYFYKKILFLGLPSTKSLEQSHAVHIHMGQYLNILEDLKIIWNMDVHYSVDIKLD